MADGVPVTGGSGFRAGGRSWSFCAWASTCAPNCAIRRADEVSFALARKVEPVSLPPAPNTRNKDGHWARPERLGELPSAPASICARCRADGEDVEEIASLRAIRLCHDAFYVVVPEGDDRARCIDTSMNAVEQLVRTGSPTVLSH